MELLVERTFAIFIAISGPILTIFDLPGNTAFTDISDVCFF